MDYIRKKTTLILLALFLFLSLNKICFGTMATMAASGPALNEKTKQCGYFFGGDEKKSYNIPKEWKVSFQDQEVRKNFEQCGFFSGEKTIEECCEILNYTFVKGNIADTPSKNRINIFLTILIIVIPIITIWFLYLILVKKKK